MKKKIKVCEDCFHETDEDKKRKSDLKETLDKVHNTENSAITHLKKSQALFEAEKKLHQERLDEELNEERNEETKK